MREYIGKDCKIHVQRGDSNLFYSAHVVKVTDTHITFIDKFGELLTFRISEIIEISGVKVGNSA